MKYADLEKMVEETKPKIIKGVKPRLYEFTIGEGVPIVATHADTVAQAKVDVLDYLVRQNGIFGLIDDPPKKAK